MDSATASSDQEGYYFVSSQYNDITSRFSNTSNTQMDSIVEYPETPYPKINETVAKTIDTYHTDFLEAVNQNATSTNHFMENISYQVYFSNDTHLSLAIHAIYASRDDEAFSGSSTEFWTFDKRTGEVVSLADLLGNSTDGRERLFISLRDATKRELERRKIAVTDEELKDSINAETVPSFAILNKKELLFPLGRANEGSSSSDDVEIKLQIDTLQLFLQNDTARSILDVVPIQQPAQPEQPALPSTSTGPGGYCNTQKCIALTFDDGPSIHTNRLLDILKNAKARATFFVLGQNVEKHAAILKRENVEKHEIGNHSWDHPQFTKLNHAAILSQLQRTDAIIQETISKRPSFVRPPYGAFDSNVIASLSSAGHSSILWSVDTRDWADRNASIICNRAVTGASSGGIIIMHDVHATTVDAVPCILKRLAADNYVFVTVSELIGTTKPGQTYYRAR